MEMILYPYIFSYVGVTNVLIVLVLWGVRCAREGLFNVEKWRARERTEKKSRAARGWKIRALASARGRTGDTYNGHNL